MGSIPISSTMKEDECPACEFDRLIERLKEARNSDETVWWVADRIDEAIEKLTELFLY
jgi:hypothetical protein